MICMVSGTMVIRMLLTPVRLGSAFALTVCSRITVNESESLGALTIATSQSDRDDQCTGNEYVSIE